MNTDIIDLIADRKSKMSDFSEQAGWAPCLEPGSVITEVTSDAPLTRLELDRKEIPCQSARSFGCWQRAAWSLRRCVPRVDRAWIRAHDIQRRHPVHSSALGMAALLPNIARNQGRTRLFWGLMTMGIVFWLAYQFMWSYFEVILRTDVPNPFVGDIVIFLHFVR